MVYWETTIVVEDDASNWVFPLTANRAADGPTIESPVTLMTDSDPHGLSEPTRVKQSYTPTPEITSPFMAPSDLSAMNSFGGELMTTDSVAKTGYNFPTASTSGQSVADQRISRDQETKKVILGSILGGVLGFALFAIMIFCLLTYFGGRYNGAKRKRMRQIRNSIASQEDSSHNSFRFNRLFGKHKEKMQSGFSGMSSHSPDIPINEHPVPYIDSPFESEELLRFKPTDPQNKFAKHEKLPLTTLPSQGSGTIPNLIAYSDEDINRNSRDETAVVRNSGVEKKQLRDSAPVKRPPSAATLTSSVYSPQEDNNSNARINESNQSNPFEDQNKSMDELLSHPNIYRHPGPSVGVTPPYMNAPFPRKHPRISGQTDKPKSVVSSVHDDGHGEYADLCFDERVFDVDEVKTPAIPLKADDSRRTNAMRKIREIGEIHDINTHHEAKGRRVPLSEPNYSRNKLGNPTGDIRPASADIKSRKPSTRKDEALYDDYILFTESYDQSK